MGRKFLYISAAFYPISQPPVSRELYLCFVTTLHHILGHVYHIVCVCVMAGAGQDRGCSCVVSKEISNGGNSHCVTIISMTFRFLTSQGKLSAWQKLMSLNLFLFIFTFFPFPPILLFTWTQNCPKAYHTRPSACVKMSGSFAQESNSFRPIVHIQTMLALTFNSLRPFVSSQMAHKSVIHWQEPNKLCWPQVVLASVFLWVLKVLCDS